MPVQLHGTYYTLTEAAEKLGYVNSSTIRALCLSGEVFAHKVGKTWLIEQEELERLASQEQKPQGNRGFKRK